ncbi:MAG TPA: hypothetical protein VIK95_12730 [Egibacteraceae bacterium]
MSVFVVLALALAVAAVGGVIVAALQLLRASRDLRAGVERASQRLDPLTQELSDEAAVAATELEALQASIERLSASRRERRRPATFRHD